MDEARTNAMPHCDRSRANAPVEITVLMPCLNEARTLGACIAEARAALDRLGLSGEVLVADNGSADGSQEIARAMGARVIHVSARGYGSALSAGIEAARGQYVLMGDADGSYDFGHVDRFRAKLQEGYDLVMGNRFQGGIAPGAMPWKNRYLGNPALSFIGRLFFRVHIGDFHCGLRGFRTDAIRRLGLATTGMEFASEMVIKAQLNGLRVTEVPTQLRPDQRDRAPHLRPWRDGWRHLRFMLLFSPRWLFLYPGVALIAVGGLVGARLLHGPWRIFGAATLDVHTLLFSAVAVLLGVQSVSFAVLTKAFSQRTGLQPNDPAFNRWMNRASLEAGLLCGGALAATGLALSAWALWFWGSQHFGNLNPTRVLRWVITGGTLMTLGCQLALVSFFLGVLGIRAKSV